MKVSLHWLKRQKSQLKAEKSAGKKRMGILACVGVFQVNHIKCMLSCKGRGLETPKGRIVAHHGLVEKADAQLFFYQFPNDGKTADGQGFAKGIWPVAAQI